MLFGFFRAGLLLGVIPIGVVPTLIELFQDRGSPRVEHCHFGCCILRVAATLRTLVVLSTVVVVVVAAAGDHSLLLVLLLLLMTGIIEELMLLYLLQ